MIEELEHQRLVEKIEKSVTTKSKIKAINYLISHNIPVIEREQWKGKIQELRITLPKKTKTGKKKFGPIWKKSLKELEKDVLSEVCGNEDDLNGFLKDWDSMVQEIAHTRYPNIEQHEIRSDFKKEIRSKLWKVSKQKVQSGICEVEQ